MKFSRVPQNGAVNLGVKQMLDLNRIAKRLLNSDLPEVIRAIDLYELQAEGFLRKKSHRPFARKLCAMMLIDEGTISFGAK